MLDPLTAIGLASSIVQLVDYGTKLLAAGYVAYKSSESVNEKLASLDTISSDLESISIKLVSASASPQGTLSHDEAALLTLATRCQEVAGKLLGIVRSLDPSGKGLRRALDAVRQEVRRSLKADTLKELQAELADIRAEIGLRMLKILRDENSDLQTEISSLIASNEQSRKETATLINGAKAELLAAVTQLNSQIASQSKPHSATASPDAAINRLSEKLQKLQLVTYEIIIARRVLGSLTNSRFHDRYSTIRDPAETTFQWIFESDATPFRAWLEKRSNRIFWVSGVAGSGKSTLMKFLANEQRTRQGLQTWAGSARLIIASFYFWHSGSDLERSQRGLLQSLLFQVVRSVPQLASQVCPASFLEDDYFPEYADPWTKKDLIKALKTALSDDVLRGTTRFCFFVDGLDEYEDEEKDHMRLIGLISSLAKCQAVKLCVSSRPWKVFKDAYGEDAHAHLRLEDLTEEDMKTFIRDEFMGHPKFEKRLQLDPDIYKLIQRVQDRANGVFLWVFLVVRSLCRGLTADDTVQTLSRRLETFPTDMHEFFHRMLNNIDDVYKAKSSWILLILASVDMIVDLAPLYLLDQDFRDPDHVFGPISNGDTELFDHWQREAAIVIENGLQDLVVVRKRSARWYIDVTHRSVGDFLHEPDVQNWLQHRAGNDFDPKITVCRLSLAMIKSFKFEDLDVLWRDEEPSSKYSDRVLKVIDDPSDPLKLAQMVRILDEVDRVTDWRETEYCQVIDRSTRPALTTSDMALCSAESVRATAGGDVLTLPGAGSARAITYNYGDMSTWNEESADVAVREPGVPNRSMERPNWHWASRRLLSLRVATQGSYCHFPTTRLQYGLINCEFLIYCALQGSRGYVRAKLNLMTTEGLCTLAPMLLTCVLAVESNIFVDAVVAIAPILAEFEVNVRQILLDLRASRLAHLKREEPSLNLKRLEASSVDYEDMNLLAWLEALDEGPHGGVSVDRMEAAMDTMAQQMKLTDESTHEESEEDDEDEESEELWGFMESKKVAKIDEIWEDEEDEEEIPNGNRLRNDLFAVERFHNNQANRNAELHYDSIHIPANSALGKRKPSSDGAASRPS